MNITDIIAHALVNSGIVPSYNYQEIPGEYKELSRTILLEELIPQMNADRTLDVSVISRIENPSLATITLTFPGNMDWMPARVDAVLDHPTGVPYTYIYPTEFWNIDYRFHPFVYTLEMGEDFLKILFRHSNTAKRLIIPQPLYASDDNTLVAPPKFKQYLIDALAVRLAVLYQMATLPIVDAAAKASYNKLLKQQPVPFHPVNIRSKIRSTIKSSNARYWRFDGFA